MGEPSIQQTFEEALFKLTGEEIPVVGSGRTDSGVHALGQVVHFVLKRKPWKPEVLLTGLNSHLPPSIRVLHSQEVPMDFHAQRSATHKQYSFYFQQGPCPLPHLHATSWWIKKRLDVERMSQSLAHLVGEHDFKPFQGRGAKPIPTVRKILEADVTRIGLPFPLATSDEREALTLVRVRVVGTGFLKQMVRGIAGTLLEVGEHRREPDSMREILERQERDLVGATAPGKGLWLERVWYAGFPDLTR